MKSKTKSSLFAWGFIVAALLFVFGLPLAVHAAAVDPASTITADASTVVPVSAQNIVLTFFLHLAVAHPLVATLLSLMALARTWAKPVSSIIHTIVDLTPSKTDDGLLNSVLTWFTTPVGKTVAYVIDWVTSIKIVPPAKPAAPAA